MGARTPDLRWQGGLDHVTAPIDAAPPITAASDGAGLRATLRQISRDRPGWGYRRAHQLLLEEGWQVNRKRTQRLWRLGDSTVSAQRLMAEAPDHVWMLDFEFGSDRRRQDRQAAGRRRRVHS